MKIALKYCGGCNPVYERENIAKWLKKDFENIEIGFVMEQTVYDLVIVICGCSAECVSEKYFDIVPIIYIHSEAEYQKIKNYIKQKHI